jgi:peptidoglycan-N-acetylglucosamine deacetylase
VGPTGGGQGGEIQVAIDGGIDRDPPRRDQLPSGIIRRVLVATAPQPHRSSSWLLGPLAPVWPWAADRLHVTRILPASPGVALTFDDGPHPEGTPAVLDILAAAGARAMFFLVGEQVQKRPELAARIKADGHLIALHGYRHRLQLRMSRAHVRDDVQRGAAAVEDAAGSGLGWHRPPYGVYSPAGLEAARAVGLKPLLWSRWGKDWRKFTTPARITARATRDLGPGDVILLHDADFYSARGSHRRTVEALPGIIKALKQRGLGTVLPV